MAVENSGNVTVAWNGSGIFSVCQYACGNTAVGFELSGISGIYGPADGRKTNVVPDLIYGEIIAPLAEEIVFRWLIYLRLRDYMRMGAAAVISGLIFGIYHGNLVQAVYASLLGIVFAYILDISGCLWSSVLLHMGANIWSLISPDLYTWIIARNPAAIMILFLILLMVMILGCFYFTKRVQGRSKRVI